MCFTESKWWAAFLLIAQHNKHIGCNEPFCFVDRYYQRKWKYAYQVRMRNTVCWQPKNCTFHLLRGCFTLPKIVSSHILSLEHERNNNNNNNYNYYFKTSNCFIKLYKWSATTGTKLFKTNNTKTQTADHLHFLLHIN